MAKYTLIIKDEVYIKLYRIAGKKGISLGKLMNQILEDYVEKHYPMLFAESSEKK